MSPACIVHTSHNVLNVGDMFKLKKVNYFLCEFRVTTVCCWVILQQASISVSLSLAKSAVRMFTLDIIVNSPTEPVRQIFAKIF